MGEDISIVIDNLCEKLGTTLSEFVPEYAKYNMTSNCYSLAVCTIIVIAGVFGLKKGKKLNDDISDWAIPVITLSALAVIMGSVCILYDLWQLIIWNVSPLSATVDNILKMMR